jgi:hypothetical protein
MSQPIVHTNGQHEIKIYTVKNRGRAVFQLSYYEGGHRQRRTYGKLSDARREAKVVLGRLAVNTHEAEELSTAAMESYVIALKHIASTGLPLHVCAELFVQAHTIFVPDREESLNGAGLRRKARMSALEFAQLRDPLVPRGLPRWLQPLRLSLRYFALVRERLSRDPGPAESTSSHRSVRVQQAESVRIRL